MHPGFCKTWFLLGSLDLARFVILVTYSFDPFSSSVPKPNQDIDWNSRAPLEWFRPRPSLSYSGNGVEGTYGCYCPRTPWKLGLEIGVHYLTFVLSRSFCGNREKLQTLSTYTGTRDIIRLKNPNVNLFLQPYMSCMEKNDQANGNSLFRGAKVARFAE